MQNATCPVQQTADEKFDIEVPENQGISGRRIVDIKYFLEQLKLLNDHSPFTCTFSDMKLVSEKRNGLRCALTFKCNMCNVQKILWSEASKGNSMDVNKAAITGIMNIGGGYANIEELLSIMDIPPMSVNTFSKIHGEIADAWEKTALKEMEKAGNEERQIALENGSVDNQGTPLITVIADGSWAKRSYRTNYSSLSGVVSSFFFNLKYFVNYMTQKLCLKLTLKTDEQFLKIKIQQ